MVSSFHFKTCFFYYIIFFLLLTACQGEKLVPPANEDFFDMKTSVMDDGHLVVQLEVKEETDSMVIMNYELSRETEDRVVSIERLELFHDILPIGMQKEFILPLPQVKDGRYSIHLQALTEEDEHGNRWGGLWEILFTIKDGDTIIEFEGKAKE